MTMIAVCLIIVAFLIGFYLGNKHGYSERQVEELMKKQKSIIVAFLVFATIVFADNAGAHSWHYHPYWVNPYWSNYTAPSRGGIGIPDRTEQVNDEFCAKLRKRINDPETSELQRGRFVTKLKIYKCGDDDNSATTSVIDDDENRIPLPKQETASSEEKNGNALVIPIQQGTVTLHCTIQPQQ